MWLMNSLIDQQNTVWFSLKARTKGATSRVKGYMSYSYYYNIALLLPIIYFM
jgi:hypothetical protein